MNKAITDGLVLMPPPFAAGLNLWSQGDGTPGSASYAGVPGTTQVPADQDFGGCLELLKTAATQKLRCFQQIPIQPGLYLRVTARVKAILGNLPAVRIAAWAGNASGANVNVPQTGPSVQLASYGEVVTVSAIIGSGNRTGVDMVWGTTPVYGHFGLDLTGPTGGIVRIDDITVEDVTSVFHRKMLDWVDVRDFGARGDGTTDDRAAFQAADAAATGGVLVSAGTYLLNGSMTFNRPVRFEGTLTMPATARLVCARNFTLETYTAAFGNETEGFRRGLAALFQFTDHVAFDLGGRRVALDGPVDVAAVAGVSTLAVRRVLQNGVIEAATSTAWDPEVVTSVATYTPGTGATTLTGVANVANIPVGARVSGAGVGREVYVRSRNVAAATVELSLPLWSAGTRTFTFTRYRYLLDLSGFAALSRFEMSGIEFFCEGKASGVMLAPSGSITRFASCVFNRPRDRGITSIGAGCQGLIVDQCQFLSNETDELVQDRTTIALNINANDAKLRDNRVVRFAHFAVVAGGGSIIAGNHFFQGDGQSPGPRAGGLVFTTTNHRSFVNGNYIDNCSIEWTNEHDSAPDFSNEFSFGGLSIIGNTFMASDALPSFAWLVVKPHGPGHFINGLSVTDNVFRSINTSIDRIERVDATHAALDFSRMRNLTFSGNSFNGVTQVTQNPVMIEHVQNTAADTWTLDAGAFLPFGGWARNVQALVAEGPVTTSSNSVVWTMPYVLVEQGTGARQVLLKWSGSVKGRVHTTIRVDNPN